MSTEYLMTFEQVSLLTTIQLYRLTREVPNASIRLFYTDATNGTTTCSFDCPAGQYDLVHYPHDMNPPTINDVIHVGARGKTPAPMILGHVAALFNCKWHYMTTHRLLEVQSPFMLVFLVLVTVLAAGPDHPWVKDIKPVDPYE